MSKHHLTLFLRKGLLGRAFEDYTPTPADMQYKFEVKIGHIGGVKLINRTNEKNRFRLLKALKYVSWTLFVLILCYNVFISISVSRLMTKGIINLLGFAIGFLTGVFLLFILSYLVSMKCTKNRLLRAFITLQLGYSGWMAIVNIMSLLENIAVDYYSCLLLTINVAKIVILILFLENREKKKIFYLSYLNVICIIVILINIFLESHYAFENVQNFQILFQVLMIILAIRLHLDYKNVIKKEEDILYSEDYDKIMKSSSKIGLLFTYRGRINRALYVGIGISIQLCALVLVSILNTYIFDFFIIGIIAIGHIFNIIKRLHDIGKPGRYIVFLLIPLFNIYLFIMLMYEQGLKGKNQYGHDPLDVLYNTNTLFLDHLSGKHIC